MSKIRVQNSKPGISCRVIRLNNKDEVEAAYEIEEVLHGFRITLGESEERGEAGSFVPINAWADTICRLINLRANQRRSSRNPRNSLPDIKSFLQKFYKKGVNE